MHKSSKALTEQQCHPGIREGAKRATRESYPDIPEFQIVVYRFKYVYIGMYQNIACGLQNGQKSDHTIWGRGMGEPGARAPECFRTAPQSLWVPEQRQWAPEQRLWAPEQRLWAPKQRRPVVSSPIRL